MKKLTKEKKLLEGKMKKLRREKLCLLLRQEQIKEGLIRKITKNQKHRKN